MSNQENKANEAKALAPTALEDINEKEMLAVVSKNESIRGWSEDKRKEFMDTYLDRSLAAACILAYTADYILKLAEKQKFIPSFYNSDELPTQLRGKSTLAHEAYKVYDKKKSIPNESMIVDERMGAFPMYVISAGRRSLWSYDHDDGVVGGRSITELKEIARERANKALEELPPLKTTVQIIEPETAKKIDRKEVAKQELEKAKEELRSLVIWDSIEDAPSNITISEFKKQKSAQKKRKEELNKVTHDLTNEVAKLEDEINKTMAQGVPGLREAIYEVALGNYEKAISLGTMRRRVNETVKFGDSDFASKLLKQFENDEVKVSKNVEVEFRKALEQLKLVAPKQGKKAKALAAPKKK